MGSAGGNQHAQYARERSSEEDIPIIFIGDSQLPIEPPATVSDATLLVENILKLKLQMDVIESKLPLKEVEDIKSLEEKLQCEEAIKIEMGRMFQMIGGTDGGKLVRRALSKVFSDELAAKCSWTGAKNNHKIGELTLISELKNIVQKVFPNTSDYEFERVVKDFFRYAEQRKSRKKQTNQ
ncbi:hypothetical protein NQ317_014979 [Molorchus minor]|uniref:BEN domain-containing protein n=1 Tax=Molorchus minor TaxID=1323400 RepID=A0ABQ9JAV1_9CUCU|nr:hypothetical protein NQ317_014979 [Molorchus minor]